MLIRFPIAVLLVASACLNACGTVRNASGDGYKKEAATAFNDIVRRYFAGDCAGYRTLYAKQIKIIVPNLDTTFESRPLLFDDSFCDRFGLWTAGLVSFDDYAKRFEVVVYSRDEFSKPSALVSARDSIVFARSINSRAVMNLLAANPYGITDRDYLVIGDVAREAGTSSGLGAPFIVVLRMTDDGWRIFGVLP